MKRMVIMIVYFLAIPIYHYIFLYITFSDANHKFFVPPCRYYPTYYLVIHIEIIYVSTGVCNILAINLVLYIHVINL